MRNGPILEGDRADHGDDRGGRFRLLPESRTPNTVPAVRFQLFDTKYGANRSKEPKAVAPRFGRFGTKYGPKSRSQTPPQIRYQLVQNRGPSSSRSVYTPI
jgi:hypothetical protein